MASNTEHYKLVKPDYTESADVKVINGNMDIIDSLLYQLANAGTDANIISIEGSDKKAYFEIGTDGILKIKEA